MTAPVDVLAVLRKTSHSVPNDDFVAFDDAFAAVDELIGFVQDCADGRPEAEPSECRKRAIDLLARVGGAK